MALRSRQGSGVDGPPRATPDRAPTRAMREDFVPLGATKSAREPLRQHRRTSRAAESSDPRGHQARDGRAHGGPERGRVGQVVPEHRAARRASGRRACRAARRRHRRGWARADRRGRSGDRRPRARPASSRARTRSTRRRSGRRRWGLHPAASRSRTVPSRRGESFCDPSIATCTVVCPVFGLANRSRTSSRYRARSMPSGATRVGSTSSSTSARTAAARSGSATAWAIVACPRSAPR